jgi:hypothetical protein
MPLKNRAHLPDCIASYVKRLYKIGYFFSFYTLKNIFFFSQPSVRTIVITGSNFCHSLRLPLFLSLLFAIILKEPRALIMGYYKRCCLLDFANCISAAGYTLQSPFYLVRNSLACNNCRVYIAVTLIFLSTNGKIPYCYYCCRVSMCVNSKSFPYTNTYAPYLTCFGRVLL